MTMRWEITTKGSTIGYTGYADKAPVSEMVSELWQKYIAEAAPKNAEIVWDHLRVEIWLDSGRVIVFPTPSPYHYRVEKAVCQVICPDLLASYNEVADSGLPDDAFDVWASQAIEKVATLVSQAAREARLPERLGRQEIKILYYSYGGDLGKPIKEETLRQC